MASVLQFRRQRHPFALSWVLKGVNYRHFPILPSHEVFSSFCSVPRPFISPSARINISQPHLWYPSARNLAPRQIICHVGPTNSGFVPLLTKLHSHFFALNRKTFTALNSLIKSPSGIYCGPLRLLAWEITEKLRSHHLHCSLLTGQEKDLHDQATHISCTIEMVDLSTFYHCAVIDEMQVIGDPSRGWAWTSAFLGLQSSEIHLCGNHTYLPLIEKLCSQTNDQLIVKEYSRKSPLRIARTSLRSSYEEIQKGDCVIAFNRRELYQIKNTIERHHQHLRCCII
jgi:ATP-dependent RNA helicase SUPV3L1/SUV3